MPFPQIGGLPPGKKVVGIVDYDNVKVEWNRYELDSGVTLCLTSLPATIFVTDMTDPKGMPGYVITWNNLVRITAPENMLGAPAPPPNPEALKRAPSSVVRPLTVSEPWCEFELKDGHTLRSRLIVTEIRRVNKAYDQAGMPLFMVNSQTVVDVSDTQTTARE